LALNQSSEEHASVNHFASAFCLLYSATTNARTMLAASGGIAVVAGVHRTFI
jgi:hypothetical protein